MISLRTSPDSAIMHTSLTLLLLWLSLASGQIPISFDMDEKANCGRSAVVDDSGVRLNGRGNTSPSQPELECIIYLKSAYANDDGSNKLQVEVEALNIRDCNVVVQLFNGRNSVGNTLQTLSCQYGSAGIFYSTSNEVTVKFSRPDQLVHNEYQFTLLIKPYKDRDVPGTQTGVSSLSVAAIIGIIIGFLVLIALIILFLWCCCTGRLGNLNIPGMRSGVDNDAMFHEKSNAEIMRTKDPIVWDTKTEPQNPPAPRLYQQNRNSMNYRRRFDEDFQQEAVYVNQAQRHPTSIYARNDPRWDRGSRHHYEPYNTEKAEPQKRPEKKETLIDDVFESDSDTKDITKDETLQKRPQGSPKTKRKDGDDGEGNVPEASHIVDQDSPQLDLQSQPDADTITSPHHVNAGVRASVEDLDHSPHNTLDRKNKDRHRSPKSKRKEGKGPDPRAIPPEAFDPIFTAPITGIDYKSSQQQAPAYGFPQGYPGYLPYGLVPAGMLAPGVPGTQTYAYAYQTVPPGGVPGQQGAWVVQNTPTTDGNRRTAYVMEETLGDKANKPHNSTPESKRRGGKHHDDRSSRGGGRRRGGDRGPDMSVIARGAAPPDPGQGHRSVAMKSGTDPDTGIHTTQVVWKDTAPDPSDPKPGENPQVTRKTITRVTTKSGYGDLPPETNPLMLLDTQEEEPDFISPSKGRLKPQQKQAAFLAPLPPSASATIQTPDRENVDFYTGPYNGGNYSSNHVEPPVRSSTPETSVHQHQRYNAAIRDRIPIDDSTV